jgi:predicted dehydrogenase
MGGGALLDVGIYCVAPLLLAAGGQDPVSVSAAAVVTESGVDSSCSGWLEFEGGFTGAFECSFETPERQSVEFVGVEGAVRMERSFTPGQPETAFDLLHRDGSVERLECPGGDPYRGMVDHVSTVIRGGDRLRRPPAESIKLLAVLDRLRAAAGLP